MDFYRDSEETSISTAKQSTVAPVEKVESGEDLLLIQIDAFRDKAKQLQTLIKAKENKVKVLEETVRAKEEEIATLQATLAKKQEEADSIVADVNVQVDRMMQSIKENMDELEDKISSQVESNETAAEEQAKAMQETLNSMNESLEIIKADLSEKVHTENVKVYRNIQDLMKELDHSEEDLADRSDKFVTLKSGNTVSLIFTIINLLLTGCLGAILLFFMGIF